ncbi:hypothetical protein MWG07_11890 [Fusobacterium necrophorum]|uniref:Phage gp6-like head-tail connector protein n=1 Tax=Fusobacterium necrophorum TaxID=859 RepID=A0AAW6WDQ3_9FUSO|nr:hypothetical protein [Fusobacterium necrophorum]KYM49451.1 hypothetical protein A2U11_10825 [Fusobacterium necrophorum subsp. funduliforme]MDK4481824.1 hypothetical protein [Fusobacterium necrophorum]MDK4512951.1 hypothetical protein [Fusobacterium necrophorum]
MNIPEIILKKVQVAMRLQAPEFQEYLRSLEKEARVYIKHFFIVEEVEEEVMKLCIDLHVQYTLFSKIEYESIAEDKLQTLHNIIRSFNESYEKKNPVKRGGVTFI